MKKNDKAIVVKGGAGLSRRQLAALRADGGVQFPPLPASLVTRPKDLSLASYANGIAERAGAIRGASPYLRMLINPFDATSRRYPDESIVPTGVVHLTTSNTYTVDASAASVGFYTFLNWKLRTASGTSPFHATYYPPIPFGGTITYADYGGPQSSWAALSAVDRTLACAVRARLVGLPTSTFVPSGTLYFIQYQVGEGRLVFDTEAECIQAVTAKKGFSVTVAELARLGAVHIPYLPQGPMSYVFSATNSDAASGIPDGSAGPVASNGGLFVIGFGLQAGTIIRWDYSHHVEYIPTVAASGLIETKVELPSTALREGIADGAQKVLSVIGGGTTANDLKVLRPPSLPGSAFNNLSTGMSTLDSMLSTASGLFGAATKMGSLFM